MDTAKRVAPPYNVCLQFWVAKLETSQTCCRATKTNGIGGAARLAVSITIK